MIVRQLEPTSWNGKHIINVISAAGWMLPEHSGLEPNDRHHRRPAWWLTHFGLTSLPLRTAISPPSPPRGNFRDKEDIRVQAATIHEWDQNQAEP